MAGRPPASSRAEIEAVALRLFTERGFDETTVEDIAAAAGIGRRTFFRYFRSKNDVIWGEFDAGLDRLRETLQATPADADWWGALRRAVVEFNRLDPADVPLHRIRMELILHVPALQAYSTLMYAAWREVVADFVGDRTGAKPDDFEPRLVGHTALAAAVAAYEQWLCEPSRSLDQLLDEAMSWLARQDVSHGRVTDMSGRQT